MSTHARPLAEWLSAASDEQLSTLFTARRVRPDVNWQDFFDAAEALLDPASLARVLPTLTRDEAAALLAFAASPASEHSAQRETLESLALLRPDGAPFPPVVTAVADRAEPSAPSDTVPEPTTPGRTAPGGRACRRRHRTPRVHPPSQRRRPAERRRAGRRPGRHRRR